jgi:5-formyltetrahydrofolate cyclo-ligase
MNDPQEMQLRVRVKKELRKRMRGVRATLPEVAHHERSSLICQKIQELPMWTTAHSVAFFHPIVQRKEINILPLVLEARAQQKRTFFPWIDPDSGEMLMREVSDESQLFEQGLGFAAPPPNAHAAREGELDLMIVPALAADPRGQRIGYGAGYYDRMLPLYCPPAQSVGVVFDFQIIAETPTTEGDIPLNWIVTDQRTLSINNTNEKEIADVPMLEHQAIDGVLTIARLRVEKNNPTD